MSTTIRVNGREVRKSVPRTSHGQWKLLSREDRNPVAILQAQAADRVPELVPIRYGRMLQSPFAFYRGAAALMAHDLATTPTTSLIVQLCGDAHLVNFGGFSAPDRAMVFDVNDFDETLPGPFEWDLKRLAASFVVAGRARSFTPGARATLVRAAVDAYREAMKTFAGMTRLDVWYSRLGVQELLDNWGAVADEQSLTAIRRALRKSESRTNARAFSRYSTVGADGRLHLLSQPPLLVPLEELLADDQLELARNMIREAVTSYMRSLPDDRRVLLSGYDVVGFSRKVVGVGSVGTRCWIALLVARDDPLDDLVLQVKEASASVLEPHAGPSDYRNNGQRVVEGQRLMQAASDALLGWERNVGIDGELHDYYVRQMWDGKISADPLRMPPKGYLAYAGMCGWTLARAHARSGDRHAVAGYLGTGSGFADALVQFSEGYADQNEADFALLRQAVADGVIEAVDG